MVFTKETAPKAGKKGGMVKSDYKKLIHRKYCSPSCPFFDKCPLMPLAMKETITLKDGRVKHPCLLKQSPLTVQRTIKRLFLDDEEGFLDELKEAIFLLKSKASGSDIKEWVKYVETLIKAQNVIYGQKIKEEGHMDINININVIGDEDE